MKIIVRFLALSWAVGAAAGCGSAPQVRPAETPVAKAAFLEVLEQPGTNSAAVSILPLADGSKIIVSNVHTVNLRESAQVVRLGENGDMLWAKKISHQGSAGTRVSHARLAPDGKIVLAGCAVEAIPNGPLSIKTKGAMWICQLDETGKIISDLVLRSDDEAVLNESAADVAFVGQNLIVVGEVDRDLGWQRRNSDLVAICLDQNLQTVWMRRYDSFDGEAAIGCIANGSNVVISGYVRQSGWAYLDAILLSLDAASGAVVAAQSYNSKNASLFPQDILVDQQGNVTIAGYRNLYGGLHDAAIWKVDSNLKVVWSSFFKFKGTVLSQIIPTASGGYLAAGMTYRETDEDDTSKGLVVEMSSDGKPMRSARIAIGPESSFTALLQTAEGVTLAGGSTLNASPDYFQNLLVMQSEDVFASPLAQSVALASFEAAFTQSVAGAAPAAISSSKLNLEVEIMDAVLFQKQLQ